MWTRITNLPLFLLLMGVASLSMYVPAIHALVLESHHTARSFFYAGTLGMIFVTLVSIALSSQKRQRTALGNLMALVAAFLLLPLLLAVPFHEAVKTTSFMNAYLEMTSCLTTTGASLYDPERLSDSLHLWRAQVGWMGGLLMWVAAAAVLAPLNLGGFEITASAEPGQSGIQQGVNLNADPARRVMRVTAQLFPIYGGLTLALTIMLMMGGDSGLVAVSHAMSTMSTSGISPVDGMSGDSSGIGGEMIIALFMLFALSRMTFSTDTITSAREGIHHDPEFRLGMLIILGVPALLFLRHWFAAFEVDETQNLIATLRALWGGIFTVLSFLTTTGFESADWNAARDWSGLNTPGLIFLGLSLVGGGVATTAGGVKLLRVYALYLNGLREMERLVHPSSVSGARAHNRRIRRRGAYIAWIFFMLFALTLAGVTVVFAALGASFEQALILSISTLSTTGPLLSIASETPIHLTELGSGAKIVAALSMVVGRLETLAIISLLTSKIWHRWF